MRSKAATVDDYFAEIPAGRRPALEQLRALCRQYLAGYEECIEYGLPSYRRNGALEVAFASQKNYISLYVMKNGVVEEFRPALTAASIGKGCIRFSRPERMDFQVLIRLLQRTAEANSGTC